MPEQYTYQVGKINFIVTPVYKDKRSGETMKDILLKLMLADLESGDILNIGGKRRYNTVSIRIGRGTEKVIAFFCKLFIISKTSKESYQAG